MSPCILMRERPWHSSALTVPANLPILRAITGFEQNTIRRNTYDGKRIDGLPPDEIVKMGISMAPEGRRVFPYMSVKDNLLMGAFIRSDKGGIAEDLEKVLEKIPPPAGALPTIGLNDERRRTTNAGHRAGADVRPRLLLLDEPSLALRPNWCKVSPVLLSPLTETTKCR